MGTFRVFLIRFAAGLVLTVAGITAILAILARVIKSPANLGVRDGKLALCPNSPNCVSTQSEDPRHKIDPIPYTTSLAETKEALLQVIRSMDRTKIVTQSSSYIHAEFRTKGIGYVDDVETMAQFIEQQLDKQYAALAEQTSDRDGKAMFEWLAKEEQSHLKLLTDVYWNLNDRGVLVWPGL